MTTSSDEWTTGVKSYADYFREPRAAPPDDMARSETLNPHEPFSAAGSTITLTTFDPATLQHGLGPVTLDIAFVRQVLAETGPIIDQDNSSLWQFARQPRNFPLTALHEADYYDWLIWAVCGPAASAVNAVRDKLTNAQKVDKVNNTQGGGAADIIHRWSQGVKCTPHAFKRNKVLRVHGESVLDFLVQQAGAVYGYNFLSTEPLSTFEGKGKRYQTVTRARQSCDQPLRQLGYSSLRGYVARMAAQSYSSPALAIPCQVGSTVTFSRVSTCLLTSGRLIFLFVASRGLIAKTAHGPTASQRLIREYNAYTAMRTLQGAAIPTVIGMFITKDGKNTVLMMSYAGKALRAFSELEPRDKLTLFHRLVRLHKTGVQHNDLEPRNVTQSSSGPVDHRF
ncbi:hypothetical protein DFH09DRAFT_1340469 [Mycena vulgaris]|nr:hypothetical protein DFH09DRAFT_1340469 [Mycena vulgaris]